MAGPQYASAVMWTVGALVLLAIVLILIRIIRGVSSGTFVAGGRNRKARLAVMDAAAVDNQRRLVLVRRDDVEHLILIGGPTDVVVEQNILPAGARRTPPVFTETETTNGREERPAPRSPAPVPERPPQAEQKRAEPVIVAEPVAVEPAARPAIEPKAHPVTEPATARQIPERQEPAFPVEPVPSVVTAAPVRETREAEVAPQPPGSGSVHFLDKARSSPAPQVANTATRPVAENIRDRPEPRLEPVREEPRVGIDTALGEELKKPLVDRQEARATAEPSLEEEMKRLLGELSAPARNA